MKKIININSLNEFLDHFLTKEIGLTESQIKKIQSKCQSLHDFVSLTENDYDEINKSIKNKINAQKIIKIINYIVNKKVDENRKVSENYILSCCRVFLVELNEKVENLTLSDLNINPHLCSLLGFNNVRKMIELNVYMRSTRGMVTSFGFLYEKFCLLANSNITKLKAGFDFQKNHKNGKITWIQYKSGPDSMNKGMVEEWEKKIEEKVQTTKSDYDGIIGIGYGNESQKNITLSMLSSSNIQFLVGKKFWEFISEDPNFCSYMMDLLEEASQQVQQQSLDVVLDRAVNRIENEFNNLTISLSQYYDQNW